MRGLVEELIRRTEIFADFIRFANDVRQERQILILIGNKMIDGDIARLTVTVDSAVALFEFRWVPRTVEMQQIPSSTLKVQAFRRGVGRKQDAHRVSRI